MGGVEEWRIKLSQFSTKLKLKLSLAIYPAMDGHEVIENETIQDEGSLNTYLSQW